MYQALWLFVIFSFIGWVAEVLYALIRDRRFVNRGFLIGPYCPIYGLGVVLIGFALRPFENLAILLIGSMLLGTALEFFTGFILEKIFREKWWDYSDQPHNLNGYICLKWAILWGVGGTLATRIAGPFFFNQIQLMPKTLGMVLLTAILLLILADVVLSVVSIIGLNRKLKVAEEGEENEDTARKLRANPLHRRMLRAFPGLRSLKYNEGLDLLRENWDTIRRKSSEVLRRRNEAAIAVYEGRLPQGAEKPFAYGLSYSKLFWIFMIGNVVGCVLETIYALVMPPHQFEIRVSVVIGPFILVYGLGAVLITLCLYRLYHQKDILIFLASMVIGGAFEYICSFVQQSMFGMVSWEYSDSPLNIGGRTNLMYAFFWGVLGLLWLKDMYPFLSRLIEKIPKKVGRISTVVMTVFMVLNIALSSAAVARQAERFNDVPANDPVREFLDKYFDDDYLKLIYPHMQYVGKPKMPKPSPKNKLTSVQEGPEQMGKIEDYNFVPLSKK